MRNHNKIDKKKLLREQDHLTVPPRLEGVVKNAKMNPIRKKKKTNWYIYMTSTLHPNDFESNSGRRKVISFLRELEVRIHRLEQNILHLKSGELHLKEDVKDIFKADGWFVIM